MRAKRPASAVVVLGSAAIAIALALVVLTGYLTHRIGLVRLGTSGTPMQPNTAVALAGLGAAVVAAATGRVRLSAAAAAVPTVIAGLTAFEWASGRSLGIDELVTEAWLDPAPDAPGRMAVNTVTALLLLAVPLALAPALGGLRHAQAAVGAALAGAIAAAALTGYVVDVPEAYRWSGITSMSAVTAAALVALAGAVIAETFRSTAGTARAWAAPVAGVAAATGGLLAWRIVVAVATVDGGSRPSVVPVSMGLAAAAVASGAAVGMSAARTERQRRRAASLELRRSMLRAVLEAPDLPAALAEVVRAAGAEPDAAAAVFVVEGDVVNLLAHRGGNGPPPAVVLAAADAGSLLPGAGAPVAAHLSGAGLSIVVAADAGVDRRAGAAALLAEAAPAVLTQVLLEHERRLSARLAELERLRADLIRTVAHDIRSPLAIIRGYGELVADGDASTPAAAAAIVRSAERIERLAESLLAAARAEGGRLEAEPVELGGLLRQVGADLGAAHPGRHIDVVVAGEVVAMADATAQWQIASNLVTNALKYSVPAEPVEVRVGREGKLAVVSVLDRGPGIAAADQVRLFLPFARLESSASRQADGTGLGLYICRQLVERQGGSIAVSPRSGGGTVFSYTVPLARAS